MNQSWQSWDRKLGLAIALAIGGAIVICGDSAVAQIAPDNTLGAESSILTSEAGGIDVISGGILFYFWFMENRKLTNWDWAMREKKCWSTSLKNQLLQWEAPCWAMSFLSSINNISQKSIKQMFYSTLLADWKGLTNSGLDIFSHAGFSLRSKQLLQMKASDCKKTSYNAIIAERNLVVWFNNYNKIFENPFHSLPVKLPNIQNVFAHLTHHISQIRSSAHHEIHQAPNNTLI